MRIVFMGSPDFSVPTLRALQQAGHEIACVYSQPPRSAGRRGLQEVPTPVHQAALELGLEVRTPLNFKNDADRVAFSALNADVAIVVAYGLLLPQDILDAPKHGCLNGHGSLLPRWRGAAPIQRAIMAGDTKTAVQIMQMQKGLDTGPVALSQEISINENMTAGELHDVMMQDCAALMVEAINKLKQGELTFTPQTEDGVVYARKIEKSETRIDWSADAQHAHNHIRGLSPFPGAWCDMPFGEKLERVKLLKSELIEARGNVGEVLDDQLSIACGKGALRLTQLQRAGKKAMDAKQFQLGQPLQKGKVLS